MLLPIGLLMMAPRIASAGGWNIAWPTMGGSQFWTDVRLHGDWRIQRNALTGHYRLLDPDNVRHAWGSLQHCVAEFEKLEAAQDIPPLQKTAVILLHGLGRRRMSMQNLANSLGDEHDWTVMCMTYASTRTSVAEQAAALNDVIENLDGVQTVHLVGHSLGNIVIRHYIADRGQHPSCRHIGRVVMLAPPNNGAAMARLLDDYDIFEWIAGPAGMELGAAWDELSKRLATPQTFGIIAGSTNDGAGMNPLIPGDDDWVVGVDETWLDGADDFLVVPSIHTTIMNNEAVIEAVRCFLRHGRFRPAPLTQPAAASAHADAAAPDDAD